MPEPKKLMSLLPAMLVPLALTVPASHVATGSSIIIRHDRPDSSYLELGSKFPAVARLGGRMGDGTLIAPRWVLTAAHVARGMRDRGRSTVLLGGREYQVANFYLHPDWQDMGPHDIALLELNEEVEGIPFVPLYRGREEQGQIAVMVGHGGSGTGDSRDRKEDGMRRGATNIVDRADEQFLVFSFDEPPKGTDLEGIPGPGDSGGPALLQEDGRWFVAGVSSLGSPGPNGPGTYGATDYFGRVSSHLDWIDRVMSGLVGVASRPEMAGEIPDSPSGRRLAALLELAASSPDPSTVESFIRDNVSDDLLNTAELAPVVERWQRLLARVHDATVVRVMVMSDYHTDVELQTGAGRSLLGVRVKPDPPHLIDGVFTGKP